MNLHNNPMEIGIMINLVLQIQSDWIIQAGPISSMYGE